MLTLALDTTTRAGSVAVVRGATVLAVIDGDATRTHGERLPAELAHALDAAHISSRELDLLAVASGPGAFTGLRIGLASIQGLAMVLNLPVVAVSALDALALAAASGGVDLRPRDLRPVDLRPVDLRPRDLRPLPIAAWMDAQRGEVFAAFYAASNAQNLPTPLAIPIVGTPDSVIKAMSGEPSLFIGDGAVRYRAQILHNSGDHRVIEPPTALAPFIALVGIALAGQGSAGPPHAVQPLYVRRSDAELERQRRESGGAGHPNGGPS